MRRYPYSSPHVSAYSFGPGPLSTAMKALIAANVVMFIVTSLPGGGSVMAWLGLRPHDALEQLRIWQPATYLFMHAGLLHLLFNMLTLWMFGTELERMWGTRYFLKFYFVCGVGAGLLTVVFALLPLQVSDQLYLSLVVGASGAIYGLLLAYGLYFPNRPILMFMLFPVPAKYFVMIIGAIAFYASLGGSSGVASATHLGGLVIGYLYLKGARIDPLSELKYRYLKWKINRVRRKFDVYSGGRANDWDRRVH
jgi:membrane associated rhomboid family serine protease